MGGVGQGKGSAQEPQEAQGKECVSWYQEADLEHARRMAKELGQGYSKEAGGGTWGARGGAS